MIREMNISVVLHSRCVLQSRSSILPDVTVGMNFLQCWRMSIIQKWKNAWRRYAGRRKNIPDFIRQCRSAMRWDMHCRVILRMPRCGVCSGMQIKTCILIKTVPRCRRLQKSRKWSESFWKRSERRGTIFRTVFTAMPCWISTKCSAPAMDFFWHRTAIIPVRWSRSWKNFQQKRQDARSGQDFSLHISVKHWQAKTGKRKFCTAKSWKMARWKEADWPYCLAMTRVRENCIIFCWYLRRSATAERKKPMKSHSWCVIMSRWNSPFWKTAIMWMPWWRQHRPFIWLIWHMTGWKNFLNIQKKKNLSWIRKRRVLTGNTAKREVPLLQKRHWKITGS